VDNANRTAILDQEGKVLPGAAEILGRENDVDIAKIGWLSRKVLRKRMVQWWFMSQRAAKQHCCYKADTSLSQESQPIPGFLSCDMARQNVVGVRE
jgi:hypothetical protein